MLNSAIPTKFPIPWASSAGAGYIRTIPQASQVGVQNGAASLTTGFPPNCFTPIASGGSWPFGQDFNGILNQITQWLQWEQAGGQVFYDSAFVTAIGGYPQGAVLSSATTAGLFWISTANNNTSNPDTGGANWIADRVNVGMSLLVVTWSQSWTPPNGVTWADVQLWGAGGGGGGAYNATSPTGTGGGGGGYARKICTLSGSAISLTIGASGTGGNASGSNGTSGGTSSFGAVFSATGGQGGYGSASGGGGGGVGAGGDFNLSGIGGSYNIQGGAGGTTLISGFGGGAFCFPASSPNQGGSGAAGINYATGGNAAAAAGTGGAGAPGLMLIRY